jgi:hypothetical protein
MSSGERRAGVPPRWSVLLLGAVLGATGIPHVAQAAPTAGQATRAALDPALVAGRGASVAFLEQEAEHAATNGTVIGPDRTAYTLPAEASGRSAVTLDPGEWVEFTLPRAANAITVRYSIPDAPTGGGITAPLTVGTKHGTRTMTLTSQYSWLYNQYQFTNDPQADLLHPDWWITECQCVPAATTPAPVITKPFRPAHFYDEQRLLLGHTYRRQDPAHRADRADHHRPARLRTRRPAEDRPERRQPAAVRRRPDRPAGFRAGHRARDRVRQEG